MKAGYVCLFCLLLTRPGAAEAPLLRARVECAPAALPGRILCDLTTSAVVGKLVWSDALVVRTPAFARPLRARFSAKLGTALDPGAAFSRLALVATSAGRGNVELLARGVVCQASTGGESCTPEVVVVTTVVQVGQ